MSVVLRGGGLTLEDVIRVARDLEAVSLSDEARQRIRQSRDLVGQVLGSGTPVYGINTGFGKLKNRQISSGELEHLQINLLRSHAVGVGDPLATEAVRAMGLLRAESLAIGVSGVHEELVEALIDLLNHKVHPLVPAQGSVGASGDLAPLAHYALVLIGEGEAEWQGEHLPGGEALARAGLKPHRLGAKDGLALINGTQQSTALMALCLEDLDRLLTAAVASSALSLEGLLGSILPFDDRVAAVRPHPGHRWVAARVRDLVAGSQLGSSHEDCDRLQDPYSLRCIPQVLGTSLDGFSFARQIVGTELGSATDNPLVFPETDAGKAWRERVISAGNFHAQPISLAADTACIALGPLTGMAERRIDLLLDENRSGLPAFLTSEPGLHSGMMLLQYMAAALTSENKVLAHPASVDSIPTSAGMEDHVSMAPWAARKLVQSVKNSRYVIAAEMVAAAQALEARKPLRPGVGTAALYTAIRERVRPLEKDRPLAKEVEAISEWIAKGGPGSVLRSCLEQWPSPWQGTISAVIGGKG